MDRYENLSLYSDVHQNNCTAKQHSSFGATLLFPPHICLINEWTRFFSDAFLFAQFTDLDQSKQTIGLKMPHTVCDVSDGSIYHYRWMRSTQCQRWGLWWGVHCTGECFEMLSECSVRFHLLNLHFCFVQHSLFFTHCSP